MIDCDPVDHPTMRAEVRRLACPEYRRDAVPVGPFAIEPFDLRPLVCQRADGTWRSGPEIETCSTAWLLGALHAHDVDLGRHDFLMAGLIAQDGWSTVQVVAGWIARATAASTGTAAESTAQSNTDGLPGL